MHDRSMTTGIASRLGEGPDRPERSGRGTFRVTVIVPTYKRTDRLEQCLKALAAQTMPPHQMIVTVRDDDPASRAMAERFARVLPLDIVELDLPGQVMAINRALDHARGDIVAITDDDAVPHADWIERIEAWYHLDERIGGVGGRDYVFKEGRLESGRARTVGRLQWFGRVIGNHHLGVERPCDVDVLKGANWSLRRSAIGSLRLNTRLRGAGAQVQNDLDFSLRLRRSGWRLVYDPRVAVDHFPSVRHDVDQRGAGYFHPLAQENAAFNDTVALMDHFPSFNRSVFIVWSFLVGTSEFPGLAQWMRLTLRGDRHAAAKLRATLRGRLAGLRDRMESAA
ncbi:glycosyltransferase family 2 protein [Azospirillum sp. SYSU D00513]|uniref:glycosyltransferase family 2 protein n=1 Tax=Azospirillum sp. SYSU D00513 TaxID=2812561 RepID=UPI001FFF261A|nr:glycosyltransferase family 2 protein [Azospirillum sp. SYSU D00513]